MRGVSADVVKRLDLDRAISEEAVAWQSLVPQTPGLEHIAESAKFRSWLEGQLRGGLAQSAPVVSNARKASNGVRPVPIVALPERIAYRALGRLLVPDDQLVDRSPDRYLEFVMGPIAHVRATETQTGLAEIFVQSEAVEYVVKADIAAFYEYVDHGILAEELLNLTGDFDAIECLVDLLGDIQGRAFGLPQLLDPSDWLSEIYIDRVERAMIRRGWLTWRFNDDFRIACSDYGAALRAIEELAAVSREHGLSLSDHKTVTPGFGRYVWDTLGLQVDEGLPEQLAEHEPEDFVADYMDGIDEGDNRLAVQTVLSAVVDGQNDEEGSELLNLANLGSNDFRRLRRALARLQRNPDAAAVQRFGQIVLFVPALTPWVIRALVSTSSLDAAACTEVIRDLVGHTALTGWQRAWLLRAIDDLDLLREGDESGELLGFVERHLDGRHDALCQAEAAHAMARVGRISAIDIERMRHSAPTAMSTWYLVALARLRDAGIDAQKEISATQQDDGLTSAILASD
jgi:Reverse transcriptase (RNA-dependent DNA polymerase)